MSLIYEKTLVISPKDVNVGSATVLMNVDVEKVLEAIKIIHEFWALLVSTSIAAYLLYRQLGVSFIAPILAMVAAIGICAWVGASIRPRQRESMAATEKRVTTVSYATGATKGVRMLGLSETVMQMLSSLREIEIEKQR